MTDDVRTSIGLRDERFQAVMLLHRWRYWKNACNCGWTQRSQVPRGMPVWFNHHWHVLAMLRNAGFDVVRKDEQA